MIISDRYKYVFVEVPHTATTAISQELIRHYAGRRILGKHANYAQFRSHASKEERAYYVFAGVRNPLDIAVTDFFKYRTNHRGAFTDLEGRGKWVDDDLLQRYEFVANDGSFGDFLQKFYAVVYHNWFLIGSNGFQKVMRYESIAADFSLVLDELGIHPEEELPVVNKSKRPGSFVDLYTPELIPHAVRTFGPFMRQWNYEFPEGWDATQISQRQLLTYQLKEAVVSSVAAWTPIHGRNPTVQRVKKLIDRVF